MRISSTLTLTLTMVCAASLGLLGCDKPKPTDDPSTTSGDEPATTGEPSDTGDEPADVVAWASMDRSARLTYMGTVVMPAMSEAFKQHGIDNFKCANCHGADYKEVDFKMPNDLTPLDPENPIQSGMDLDEDMTKFMVSVVLPEMAELLGEETDVTTGKGEFGCLSCHLSE